MTQPATAEQTGSALEGQAPVQAGPLTIPDSVRASMSPEILATLPEPPADDSQQPPDDLDDGEASIDVDAGDDGAGDETDDTSPEDEVAQWVDLIDENPASITSVPRARQAEVIGNWKGRLENAAIAAVQTAYQQGMEHGRQQTSLASQAAVLAELLESGDISTFNEQVAKFPGGKKGFFRMQAEMTPLPANSPEHFESRAAQIVARLADFPEALASLKQNWNYRAEEAELERLAFDVGRLLAQAQGQKARPKTDPADQALQRRQQALKERKKAPKPDVTEGAGTASGLKFEDLLTMSVDEIRKIPKAERDRIAAAGPSR